jgi:spore photoproduct lyase
MIKTATEKNTAIIRSSEKKWSEIQKIWIDKSLMESSDPIVARVLTHFSPEQIEYVDREPNATQRGEMSADEYKKSKNELFLTKFKGQFFKRCPGARPGLTCCNYFVLNLGQQCNMDCSYCYLQSFLNSRVMKMYVNVNDAINELRGFSDTLKDSALRVGTGEVIDSLSLDPLSLHSVELIRFFNDFPKWRLEFKTKSSQVDQFINEPHKGNIIVSFSINPQNIIEQEEHGTASLHDRLNAAKKCRDKGFLISFHMDPMIWHTNWKESYQNMIHRITSDFSPKDIPVMSVGSLRFQPEQRHLMRDRFGMKSLITQAEVFASSDGKLRYDRNIREQMYKFVLQEFKSRNPAWNIFMCMESPETWLATLGHMPTQEQDLKESFDHRLIRKFEKSTQTTHTM